MQSPSPPLANAGCPGAPTTWNASGSARSAAPTWPFLMCFDLTTFFFRSFLSTTPFPGSAVAELASTARIPTIATIRASDGHASLCLDMCSLPGVSFPPLGGVIHRGRRAGPYPGRRELSMHIPKVTCSTNDPSPLRSGSAGLPRDLIGGDDHTLGVCRGVREPQRGPRRSLGEQPPSRSQHQRMDEQHVTVHEVVLDERPDQRAASQDQQVVARLLLERRGGFGGVGC